MQNKISVDEVESVCRWVSVLMEIPKVCRIVSVVNENTPDYPALSTIITVSSIDPFKMKTLSPLMS